MSPDKLDAFIHSKTKHVTKALTAAANSLPLWFQWLVIASAITLFVVQLIAR